MDDARNLKPPRANPPPANPIIGKRRADKWDEQLDGIIIDIDSIQFAQTRMAADLSAATADYKSGSTWRVVRDILILILLVTNLATIVWRGMLTEKRLAENGEIVLMDEVGND